MSKCVMVNCNNEYVPKAIISLKQFTSKNADYDMIIIGTNFDADLKRLCQKYNVSVREINLVNDFINLNKRPYGKQYPLECFYHFYAYKILTNYDYIVLIEPDIYTNRKLDIDFNLVKYIGGGYDTHTKISNFSAIMNDYKKIKKIYEKTKINQYRILGGAKIYNVKNLEKIGFYEKIIEYYKKSWEISSPRCGDDSLMTMYQMLHPEHIKLLGTKFNVVHSRNIESHANTMHFFHFCGSIPKYWNIKTPKSHLLRYCHDQMLQYIYNNFPTDFIKQYMPTIYKNIDNTCIRFYYYNKVNNFGDLIVPYFLDKFCAKSDYTFHFKNDDLAKIISCGSIMRLCNKNTIVYGSGIRDIDQNIKSGVIKFVRGPLTRKRLLEIGCYCPPIYGDPGLLLPLYYSPNIVKRYKLGIIPHHVHYKKVKQTYNKMDNILIVNLINNNIEEVIDDILSCEKTISSSLHGLIVSDAYNIPNKWIKFDDKINGDDTKYYDYFKSVNRKNTDYIDCFNFKQLPYNILDIIDTVDIDIDINKLKDNMFFDENGIKKYTKYLIEKIKNKKS